MTSILIVLEYGVNQHCHLIKCLSCVIKYGGPPFFVTAGLQKSILIDSTRCNSAQGCVSTSIKTKHLRIMGWPDIALYLRPVHHPREHRTGKILVLSRRSIWSRKELESVYCLDYRDNKRAEHIEQPNSKRGLEGCKVNRQMENIDTHCAHWQAVGCLLRAISSPDWGLSFPPRHVSKGRGEAALPQTPWHCWRDENLKAY